MLESRLIPVLLVSERQLVKTLQFGVRTYVGDPINTVRIFNAKEVDELVVLDIDASRRGVGPDLPLIADLAAEAFMPLTYGGGIRTIDDAAKVLALGVEKVAVRQRFLENPGLLGELAAEFGSQAVMVSLDVRMDPTVGYVTEIPGSGVSRSMGDCLELASETGVGELLVQSIKRDGTMQGMDLDLITAVAAQWDKPLIVAGGLSGLEDLTGALRAGADAVAGGAFFVFHGRRRAVLITYPRRKQIMEARERAKLRGDALHD